MEPTKPLAPEPDIMNDPAFDPSRTKKEKEEPDDSCRICRAEGSPSEPLFYPCKCSGSIKFVHQDCLMEWLSHSQKKHCELCKTSFRFTKLYHPQMPSTVPLPIFLRQAGIHIINSLLTWARWNLVIFVWLGWVPWSMRTVWRGLFWIGDGGWITAKEIERQTARMSLEHMATRGTSPVYQGLPVSADTATTALKSTTGGFISSILRPWARVFNFTGPAATRLARGLYLGLLYPSSNPDIISKADEQSRSLDSSQRPPSLLSELGFLKNLTRLTTLNNLAIDVLEGQLITLAVVVVFILIFLIREWVVQQQPAINGGPAIGDEQAQNVPAEPPQHPRENDAHGDEQAAGEPVANIQQRRILPMPMLRARPNQPAHEHQDDQADLRDGDHGGLQRQDTSQAVDTHHQPMTATVTTNSNTDQVNPSARPTIPSRDIFTQTGEIRRTLEEQGITTGQNWPGIEIFMDLWRRAGRNPKDVLRLIHEEGREEELGWIVSAMQKLQARQQNTEEPQPGPSGEVPESTSQNSDNSEEWSILSNGMSNDPQPYHSSTKSKQSTAGQNGTPEADPGGITPRLGPHDSTEDQTGDGWSFQGVAPEVIHPTERGSERQGPRDNVPDIANHVTPAENNANDQNLEHRTEDETVERPGPQSFGETLQEWLWGEVPNIVVVPEEEEDDGEVVNDIEDEAPFVPVAHGQPVVGDGNARQEEDHRDPEVLQAAAEAGIDPNDPEAVDDGEDLEGVMELIGMQGPIAGLIQNGMFSAVLISMSLLSGIWVPYVTGKATLVLLANPIALLLKIPLKWISTAADIIVDTSIFLAGWAFCCIDTTVRFCAVPVGWLLPFVRRIIQNKAIPSLAWRYTLSAADRLKHSALDTGLHFSESDVPIFSIVAHESLVNIRQSVSITFTLGLAGIEGFAAFMSNQSSILEKISVVSHLVMGQTAFILQSLRELTTQLLIQAPSWFKISHLRISLDLPQRSVPLDYTLAYWSAQDRVLAILFGYIFFFATGIIYLKIRNFLKDSEERDRNDGNLVEVLNQAGGVTKVILIIGIEMILFPLYCGMLLDVALLPLFKNATISSRVVFTIQSPATSTFVHWFVGTCYMFHFALFVSMCRKIMRTGVLYFIRDPDDPSFHPVRDVLERNVYTQLKKIAFSAMVYGALVMVCLGAVVWGINFLFDGIFPIHWSSNRPVLDFPVDLLAYNFLMPIAIKYFRPSKGLHEIYKWWFSKCAGFLRLTHFLFNDRKQDEEGYYIWKHSSKSPGSSSSLENETKDEIHQSTFIRTGRFVRAPASDQVRLPKGTKTFVEVDEAGNRLDDKEDSDQGPHGRNNSMFSTIYIPPNFRLRIAAFIVLLWLFAATTGVGVTVIPLLFGRAVFSRVFMTPTAMNDVYAFAIGTYLLGGPLYLGVRYRESLVSVVQHPRTWLSFQYFHSAAQARPIISRTVRVSYFYVSFTLFLPALLAMLFEAYVLIPLHTYTSRRLDPATQHTVHFVQDWTLGVLALKLAARILLVHSDTRPAQALRALVSPSNRGSSWVDPDVRLATRAFILPASVFMLFALGFPIGAARISLLIFPSLGVEDARRALIYRYAYPATLGIIIVSLGVRLLARAIIAWRAKVRDEVYLIGERLHNFGERKPRPNIGRVAVR